MNLGLGLACGSFRKPLKCGGACGSFRKPLKCGALAEVSASSLKCAAHLRKFPQACPFFEIWYFLVPISSRLCQIAKGRFPEGGYLEVRSVSGFPQPSRLQK